MEMDVLVFWRVYGGALHDGAEHASVVRVKHPPHDDPKGSILEGLVRDALGDVAIHGIVQLPLATWNRGASATLAVGDGRVGSLECTVAGWQVHI